MSFNGYKNYQTWLFMLHFGDYLFETLRERQEEEKLNYQDVYNMVESIIDELDESVDRVEYGNAFIKDIISAELNEIDKKEVTDHLIEAIDEN